MTSPESDTPKSAKPGRNAPAIDLLGAAQGGDRRSIGRLLTRVERGGEGADEVTEATHAVAGNAHIIGITGAPGSGKSTLVGQLVKALAEAGKRPAVLAIDPSSPLSGGAILGDRVRMDGVVADHDVFIRSMATRGHQGGLALAVPAAVRVFDAVGYDPVIIETVGVGQVEVDVVSAADTAVVVVAPGMGDAVQANKAGLLEVADLFIVNKADRQGATDSRRDLELMLDLGHITGAEDPTGHRPDILMTTSTTGDGVDQVPVALAAHLQHLIDTATLDDRRARRLAAEVRSRLDTSIAAEIDALLDTPHASDLLAGSSLAAPQIANELYRSRFG